ncbi:MAG: hypothetical protein V4608_02800 [Bacteroidota bacterium]
MNIISKKKLFFQISDPLKEYLFNYNRLVKIPFTYSELSRYSSTIQQKDKHGKSTLWETVLFQPSEMEDIHYRLVKMYAMMKFDGNESLMEHLLVDRVDYCPFGNSKPFRIRIVNQFNDNHDYYYVKIADASRVYGLELEDLLSPNRINFLVDQDTLVEEHIVGIPGDLFMKQEFQWLELNEVRLAKEFVKFNERCFVRLLGDMRAYNFVIDVTADFDDVQYRFRAIDFDQQCYEGKKRIYQPQYFKENRHFVDIGIKHLNDETVKQYQQEERTLIAKRIKRAHHRTNRLLEAMCKDTLSLPEKVDSLKEELAIQYAQPNFLKCNSMGEIVKGSLDMLIDRP